MFVPLILGCTLGGAVFAAFLAFFGNRSDVSRRVAELEDTATVHTTHHTTPIVRRLLAGVDNAAVSSKLSEAGWYKTSAASFVLSRFTCLAAIGGAATLSVFATQQASLGAFAIVACVAAFGFVLPTFVLDDAIKRRKRAIGNRIPDLLDMVSTTVEAGIALNAALTTATKSLQGPLADEIEIMLSDIRLGRNRTDALNAMGARARQPDLSSFVMALVQTERLGGNVGRVLDELAEEARARRLQRAEEIAAALPVKMVIPMAFFMLPALFIMIITPVAAQLLGHK